MTEGRLESESRDCESFFVDFVAKLLTGGCVFDSSSLSLLASPAAGSSSSEPDDEELLASMLSHVSANFSLSISRERLFFLLRASRPPLLEEDETEEELDDVWARVGLSIPLPAPPWFTTRLLALTALLRFLRAPAEQVAMILCLDWVNDCSMVSAPMSTKAC